MWLNVVVLLATLVIGLVGSVTSLTNSVAGKIVVSVLLLISTGVSIWLKRAEEIRNEEVYRGVRDLTLRTLPSQESFGYVKDALTRFFQNEKQLHMNAVLHTTGGQATAFIIYILFSDPDPTSGLDPDDDEIEWEDYPELVYGVVVLDGDDVRALSRLKEKRLADVLRGEIVDTWGSDDVETDGEYIASRIEILVSGMLAYKHLPFSSSISKFYSKTSNLTAIEVSPARVKNLDDSTPDLLFDESFLSALMQVPALTRGKLVFQRFDTWRSDLESHITE